MSRPDPDGATRRIGEHAVVLGASMGGLLAARVLADFYDRVTVVDRDLLPATPANRRGVPQGRHVHTLLGRGSQILGGLFPGILDELVAAGAPVYDYQDVSQWPVTLGGHPLVASGRFKNHPAAYFPSRPLLECQVRRRTCEAVNITLLEGHDVGTLTSTAARDRVTGVRVSARDGGIEQELKSDLVVDAMGRGARTPAFLDSLGYGRPAEDHLDVRLVYTSQLLRIAPGTLNEIAVLVGPVAGRPTGLALFRYEQDTWMLTLIGMAGREPPDERAERIQFAERLTAAHLVGALRTAESLTEVSRYRYPASQWRRYDKMRRFPAGLLAFGDAICSFNPIYGQGMTVAGLQAVALKRCLRQGDDRLAQRYFRAASKPIKVAWQFAVGGDLALPEVEGPRPLSVRITNRYVDRLLTAAESDAVVFEQISKVSALIDPPTRLMRPAIMFRAVNIGRQRQRHARNRSDLTKAEFR
jgi:2-polyprenyl-6-methoxyphenol hydroxylase-like FAD-dependent oxidoreductase